jgi:hypothetical protein
VGGDVTVIEPFVVPVFAAALLDLSECLCENLETVGAGPVCWCGPISGAEPAWDYCSECGNDVCGMAWVRLVSAAPFTTFPNPDPSPGCNKNLMYTVELGAMRCVPYPSGGEPPSVTAMAEVTLRQWADAQAMYRALRCCNQPLVTAQTYQPFGPTGGCVGGAWLASIGIE